MSGKRACVNVPEKACSSYWSVSEITYSTISFSFMKDAVPGEAYPTGSLEMQKAGAPDTLGKFNPGLGPQDFSLFESAKFIPKGSDLVFNMPLDDGEGTDGRKAAHALARHGERLPSAWQ